MIRLYVNAYFMDVKVWKYPGGEIGINVPELNTNRPLSVEIQLNYQSSDDLVVLALLCDILRPWSLAERRLVMRYTPYARQDRKTSIGEPNSIRVFGNFINSLKFDEVEVWDPHSDVVEAVIDRISIVPQEVLVRNHLGKRYAVAAIVAPDAGASKKAMKVAASLGVKEVIQGLKVRDTTTGAITATALASPPPVGKELLVVDDICDGGATFVALGKVLKEQGAGALHLFVTHGIFSKGLEPFEGVYSSITCPNVMNEQVLLANFNNQQGESK